MKVNEHAQLARNLTVAQEKLNKKYETTRKESEGKSNCENV